MNETFSYTYSIPYKTLNLDWSIRLSALMDFLQETATRHSEHAGFPMAWFFEEMKGWVITHWDLKIHQYPKWNDTVVVSTWPSLFKGIMADRSFLVTDSQGRVLLEGASRWVFTDLSRRRPIKPPQEMLDGYGVLNAPCFETSFKFPLPLISEMELVRTSQFMTTRRDVDTNNHINNVNYIEWVLDLIPDDLYDNRQIRTMQVSYKKECKKDTLVTTALFQRDDMFYAVVSAADQTLVEVTFSLS